MIEGDQNGPRAGNDGAHPYGRAGGGAYMRDLWIQAQPMIKVFGEQLKDARAPENVPQWAQIESFIHRRVQEACYGTKTPEEAARALAHDINSLL